MSRSSGHADGDVRTQASALYPPNLATQAGIGATCRSSGLARFVKGGVIENRPNSGEFGYEGRL